MNKLFTSPCFLWTCMGALALSACASSSSPAPKVDSSEERFIQIGSARDLKEFRDAWNRGDFKALASAPTLRLRKDVDIGVQEGWIPIGDMANPFDGNIDGQGHAITGKVVCAIPSGNSIALCGLFGDMQATPRALEGPTVTALKVDVEAQVAPHPQGSEAADAGKWTLSIGALAGHGAGLHLKDVTQSEKGGVAFGQGHRRPVQVNEVTAGGLVGMLEAGSTVRDVAGAGRLSLVEADAVHLGGIFGIVSGASVERSSYSGEIFLSASTAANAGGIAGSAFSGRGGTWPRIDGVAFTGSIGVASSNDASLGGIVGVMTAKEGAIRRVSSKGSAFLHADCMGKGFAGCGVSLGGVAGSMLGGVIADSAVTTKLVADVKSTGGHPLLSAGGILGAGHYADVSNVEFSGELTSSSENEGATGSLGGIIGHEGGGCRIGNALSQGRLASSSAGIDKASTMHGGPKGLVGLTDQRGTFIYCSHWQDGLRAAGGVTWNVALHESDSPFVLSPLDVDLGRGVVPAADVAGLLNASLSAGTGEGGQRCLKEGSYLPWTTGKDGRAHLDMDAEPRDARRFRGRTNLIPKDAHWASRIELENWAPAEVQRHWKRLDESRFPSHELFFRKEEICPTLASELFQLPGDAFCLLDSSGTERAMCPGKRGPRRLRYLRYEFAKDRFDEFKSRIHTPRYDEPMGRYFGSDTSGLQALAFYDHVMAFTQGVGVESFLQKGQGAFASEDHLTLLAMDRSKLDGLADRTKLFDQFRHPGTRGNPQLDDGMKGAPEWVRWNCFDAMNPTLDKEAAGLPDNLSSDDSTEATIPGQGKRYPFCGVGRAGADVKLSGYATPALLARQEAMDALAESVEHWLDGPVQDSKCGGDDACHAKAFEASRKLPFNNLRKGCDISDSLYGLSGDRLVTKTWTSPDGEIWTLVALSQDAFLEVLEEDESLADDAVSLARKRLDESYASELRARRDFLKSTGALDDAGSNGTAAPKASSVAACRKEASEKLGWALEGPCVATFTMLDAEGMKDAAEVQDAADRQASALSGRFGTVLASQATAGVLEAGSSQRDVGPAGKDAGKANVAPSSALARMSAVDKAAALLPSPKAKAFVSGLGEWTADTGARKQGRNGAYVSNNIMGALLFTGLDASDVDAALGRISFVQQASDASLRFKAPLTDDLAGAPDWVRWTCFEALNGLKDGAEAPASPSRRYPLCLESVDGATDDAKGRKDAESMFLLRLSSYLVQRIEEAGGNGLDAEALSGRGMDFPGKYGAWRDDEWKPLEKSGRERFEAERSKAAAQNVEAKALADLLAKAKFRRERWKSPGGESWSLMALDEASLLSAVRKAKGLGPKAEKALKAILKEEYNPLPSLKNAAKADDGAQSGAEAGTP